MSARRQIIRFGLAFATGFAIVALASWPSHSAELREVIGHRPSACPHAWCGCGLRLYLGIADKRLDLAWNWARFFPRTTAHHGAAAVRHGHVMLLERQVEGTRWLTRDFNGGRHLAWLHVRDVRGYVFVQPGTRMGAL